MPILEKIKEKLTKPKTEERTDPLVTKAYNLFEEFLNAYAAEWQRLDKNERMYIGDHWADVPMEDPNEPRPCTPVVHSCVENVKADLTAAFPMATITAEQPQFNDVATVVGEIIKQNHDACSFKMEWRKMMHNFLVAGYCVAETGYDPYENDGLGGAYTRSVNPRGIMFDPIAENIQECRAIFKFASRPKEWMEEQYPGVTFKADSYAEQMPRDEYLNKDVQKQVVLIEYWWREWDPAIGRHKVHMVKMASRQILEDSRKEKPEGIYAHGKYPFTIRALFDRPNTMLGHGFPDVYGPVQLDADKMDQIIMKNAVMASKNKMLVTGSSGFDIDDLRDWSKEVHRGENLNGVTWFPNPALPEYIYAYAEQKRTAIKEESGANDFSRGQTGGGVTAASAIAALQEMASKRSGSAAQLLHEGYEEMVRMEIEIEREYNVLPREVHYTADGEQKTATFEQTMMFYDSASGQKLPIEFAISIKVQNETRWSIMAHNELVLQMVQLGVLQPQQAVELMQFEGKEEILKKAASGQQVPPELMAQQQMAQELQVVPTPDSLLGGGTA